MKNMLFFIRRIKRGGELYLRAGRPIALPQRQTKIIEKNIPCFYSRNSMIRQGAIRQVKKQTSLIGLVCF